MCGHLVPREENGSRATRQQQGAARVVSTTLDRMALHHDRPPIRTTGSRDDLITTLEADAEAWHHLVKDRLRDEAREAAEQLRGGAASVQVGRTIYEVDEPSD